MSQSTEHSPGTACPIQLKLTVYVLIIFKFLMQFIIVFEIGNQALTIDRNCEWLEHLQQKVLENILFAIFALNKILCHF